VDTRKVLEMGGGTVLISLPKGWARKNGIVRGSSVMVEEISARKLTVKPIEAYGGHEEHEVLVDYPQESLSFVTDDVIGAYLVGGNNIRIEGKTKIARQDRDKLKAAIARLVGLEIVDEDAGRMTMQFLPDPAALDPEKIVKRMASLIAGMLRDAADGIRHDSTLLGLVRDRDDEVDRLYFLLVRTIRIAAMDPEVAERYKLEPIECLDYRVLASYLENLGDAIAEFSKRAAGEAFGRRDAAEVAQFLRTLERMGEVTIESFLARKRVQPRRAHTDVAAVREQLGRATGAIAGVKGARGVSADTLAPLERVASILVDISDLALPSSQFRPH
jgi:phosphate uptake regulator